MNLNKRTSLELIEFDKYTEKLSNFANISYETASIKMKHKLKLFNNSKKKNKLAKLKNYLNEFIENIKPNYHISKQYYLTRKLNYSKFITIIRQICKSNEIPYTSEITYNKSSYEIQYYIYC